MSLKQIIKRDKLRKKLKDQAIVVDEEPLIYSYKYSLNMRKLPVHHFKRKQWTGILRAMCDYANRTTTPMVLIVTFYVSPPTSEVVSDKALKAESTPAVMSYELCDYLLAFMEMLHHTLIGSYRQLVRIEMDKFYSLAPRTEFKLMRHRIYVSGKDTDQPEGKSKRKDSERQGLQSQRSRHESAP